MDEFAWQKQGEWQRVDFKNADGESKWVRWGGLRLLAVIPMHWHTMRDDILSRSFSYRPLMKQHESGDTWWQRSHARTHVFFILIVVLFSGLLIAGVVGLIRARGFRNLHLQQKIQYLIISLVLFGFLYIFWMLVLYVGKQYTLHQQADLKNRCRYIQAALQNIYYWDMALSDFQETSNLNSDLYELATTYEVDIHVYDLNGRLAGSSTPLLFSEGFLSSYLSASVLFTPAFLTHSEPTVCYEAIGEVAYTTAYTTLRNGQGTVIGYIAVPFFPLTDGMHLELDRFLARLLPAYLMVIILAVLLSLFIARTLVSPIRRLSEKMNDYRFGKKDNHIRYDNHDEIGELAERYNAMVDSLDEAFRRLAESERDSAWRTMARQIAHEINNPLTPMKLTIQQLQRMKGTERFDTYFQKATQTLLEQMDTLSRIASSFSTFAKMPDVRAQEVDIAEKLTAAIALFAHNEQGVPVRYVGPNSGVHAWADSEQITEVFTNIIKNALQALENREDGDIIVILQELSDEVLITVSDNGAGIAEEVRHRIFMPNFTTKSTGTGLGLAISKNIVEGSGGTISFETSEKGTKFFVRLKIKP